MLLPGEREIVSVVCVLCVLLTSECVCVCVCVCAVKQMSRVHQRPTVKNAFYLTFQVDLIGWHTCGTSGNHFHL